MSQRVATCSICGKELTRSEVDRNLLADWCHCDRCLKSLLRGLWWANARWAWKYGRWKQRVARALLAPRRAGGRR